MDLWIRSQDRMNFVKVNQISLNYENNKQIIANYVPDFIGKEGCYYEMLGTYETKERAIEILDEIHNIIKPFKVKLEEINEETIKAFQNNEWVFVFNNDGYNIYPLETYVYDMPKE